MIATAPATLVTVASAETSTPGPPVPPTPFRLIEPVTLLTAVPASSIQIPAL